MIDSQEVDNSFKYRIIGAVAILLLLIILVPMLFHNSEQEKNEIAKDVNSNSSDQSDEFSTVISPLGDSNLDGKQGYEIDEITSSEFEAFDVTDGQELNPSVDDSIAPSSLPSDAHLNLPTNSNVALVDPVPVDPVPVDPVPVDPVPVDPVPVDPAEEKTELTTIKDINAQNTSSPVDKEFCPHNVAVGWTVPVGTFSNTVNAQRIIDLLNDNGFQSKSEIVNSNGAQVTRVWVGPYETRVFASKAMQKVQEVSGVKPFIKSFP